MKHKLCTDSSEETDIFLIGGFVLKVAREKPRHTLLAIQPKGLFQSGGGGGPPFMQLRSCIPSCWRGRCRNAARRKISKKHMCEKAKDKHCSRLCLAGPSTASKGHRI
jgi:hypothetical protein